MTAASIALLEDRGVISVTGEDAAKYLDNIITNDMGLLGTQNAIFAGLLSPQGKILFEFFVVKVADVIFSHLTKCDAGYLLDVAKDQAAAVAKRLNMYKLRARVEIVDHSNSCLVWAQPVLFTKGDVSIERSIGIYRDPRLPELGIRTLTLSAPPPSGYTAADYHAHRIALGVPEGGRDYAFGELFPHEALFDQLHGVSFTKGCYVGQEIVARMEHRGTAKKRIVRVTGSAPLPPIGTGIQAGDVTIGAMGSSAGPQGLALLRLDRVVEFTAKGVALTAAHVTITPDLSDVARLMPQSPDPVTL